MDESSRLCACGCGEPVDLIRRNRAFAFGHDRVTRERRARGAEQRACACGCGAPVWTPARFMTGHQSRMYAVPAADRFWRRVLKQPGDGCWEWQGSRKPFGYGRLRIDNRTEVQAHRFSWELANGPIPDGMQVCHHCDNPPCCRPSHLFLGTQLDNSNDKIAKGRLRVGAGERHGHAKLTEKDVVAIRALYATRRFGYVLIGRLFGVSNTSVRYIIDGRTWKDVIG